MQKAYKVLFLLIITFLLASTTLGGCASPSGDAGKVGESQEPTGDNGEKGVENEGEKVGREGEEELEGEIETVDKGELETPLALTYLGHSTFLVQYADSSVLIDPYQPDFGSYGKIDLNVDAILISHNHTDHNYSPGGGQGATVLRGLTVDGDWHQVDYSLAELQIKSVTGTFHGGNLGKNGVFVLATPNLRLAYLGDIGHILQEEEIALIGKPDVLFIPVGGHYTIPPREALALIAQLSPAIVIPMHYKTVHNPDTPIGTLDDFLGLELPYPVKPRGSTLELTNKILPAQTEIWTMEYKLP